MGAGLTYIQNTGFVFYTGSTTGTTFMGPIAFMSDNGTLTVHEVITDEGPLTEKVIIMV